MAKPHTLIRQRHAAFALAALLVSAACAARADRITVNGETWNDVLIYKSSTMYYVKVPDDGTIFNVPIDAVQPGNVEIVLDPYYRDELKARYDENSKGEHHASGKTVGTSAFNVAGAASAPSPAASAGPAPSGSAPGAGAKQVGPGADPMATVKKLLTTLHFTITDEDGDMVATSPDNSTKLVFKGGNGAGGVEYTSTVPEAQAQMQAMALNMLSTTAGQAAPWVKPFFDDEVIPLLKTGGNAQKTDGGVSISAEVTKADGNVTVHVAAGPAQAG